jgi:membrane protein implicated in regulation of membrane protease activity
MQCVAKSCLGIGLLLFVMGFLLLCYCPGWYGLAAGFTGITALVGKGRLRNWGIVCLIASLAFTAFHWTLKIRQKEQIRLQMERAIEKMSQKEE